MSPKFLPPGGRGFAMRKLLSIRDSEDFWKVFSEEREARRRQLRDLPFAKKIEIRGNWPVVPKVD